jgi:hypothetical protein
LAKPVKLSKQIVPRAIAAAAAVHATLEVSGLKSVAGASGSKIIGGVSGSKPVVAVKKAFVPIKKHRILAIGAVAGASSEESLESSPHSQTTRDPMCVTVLRSEPRGQSSRASLSDSAPSLEPESSLQIMTSLGTGGVSAGCSTTLFVWLFTLLNDILTSTAACIRCSQSWCYRSDLQRRCL